MRRASLIPSIGLLLLCLGVGIDGVRRWRRRSGAVPRTPEEIAAAAQARGLPIPPACEAGVSANLALLAEHAARLRA
ncbi:AtzG-like protein [Novosphingobium sp. 9U]|uniref:AtzG-like protein n=1 Tax=Novosphingobium sp. 9U TaxID=2653158 RepID=UPI0012F37240|nr:AtzG-like protein [Novosphingobium sp. 9U]VWX46670.1 hypothetical protein NOVOSPHI9U_10210 [Novosphingobium sp. 9U]